MKQKFNVNEICNGIYECNNRQQFDEIMTKLQKDFLSEDNFSNRENKNNKELSIKSASEFIMDRNAFRNNRVNNLINKDPVHIKNTYNVLQQDDKFNNYTEYFNQGVFHSGGNITFSKFNKSPIDIHANSKFHYPDEYSTNDNNINIINMPWENNNNNFDLLNTNPLKNSYSNSYRNSYQNNPDNNLFKQYNPELNISTHNNNPNFSYSHRNNNINQNFDNQNEFPFPYCRANRDMLMNNHNFNIDF